MAISKPTHRWFYPTPDRLTIGLLAAEGVLWLSESSQSFPKGWPVLITVAVVGVVLLAMLLWFAFAFFFRWRFHFSLRSLLVLVVVVAVPCSWLSTEMNTATEQKNAVRTIKAMTGGVEWNEQPEPAWLRSLLGDDFFRRIRCVDFDAWPAPPERLFRHRAASAIETLEISVRDVRPSGLLWLGRILGDDRFQRAFNLPLDGPRVTDAGLEHIKALEDLRTVNLCETQVTNVGLEHLKGLVHLHVLRLDGLKITNTGLEKLKGLHQLEGLGLAGTQVTDAGMVHLKGLSRLRVLALDETKTTDAGLEYLNGLSRLELLGLQGTRVTDAGVTKLQQALPKCMIFH